MTQINSNHKSTSLFNYPNQPIRQERPSSEHSKKMKEFFLKKVRSFSDIKESARLSGLFRLIQYIKKSGPLRLTGDEILTFVRTLPVPMQKQTAKALLEAFSPMIDWETFVGLFNISKSLTPLLTKLYICDQENRVFLLNFLHSRLSPNEFLIFWNNHQDWYDFDLDWPKLVSEGKIGIGLIQWLEQHQNIKIPPSILAPIYARYGEAQLLQNLMKEHEIVWAPSFPPEELEECLKKDSIPPPLLKRDTLAIGQNGCRTVLFSQDGRTYSFSGYNAEALVKKMGLNKNWDSFQIYLDGHGSVFINGESLGFYPTASIEFPALPNNQHLALSSLRQGLWGKITSLAENVPCNVIDDSIHQAHSTETNGLFLQIYAPKEKVNQLHQHILDAKKKCESKELFYNVLSHNCIDFIQNSLNAVNLPIPFRDAFYTTQYLKNKSKGAIWSLLKSSSPIISSGSLPNPIDEINRSNIIGSLFTVASGLYYSLLKGLFTKAIHMANPIIEKVQKISLFSFLYFVHFLAARGGQNIPRIA